ncbi:MAG: hypothetical protein WBX14_09080 [Candidatus Udaeobacter sp.]
MSFYSQQLALPKTRVSKNRLPPLLNLFPFHWDIELFLGDSLKAIGLCQRYPDASIAFDLRKFNSIDELELIGVFNMPGFSEVSAEIALARKMTGAIGNRVRLATRTAARPVYHSFTKSCGFTLHYLFFS